MALKREEKQVIVDQVAAVAKVAYSAVAAEYNGISANGMSNLRKAARDNGVHLQVIKNTLARRALEGTDFACMSEGLKGPMVLAFSKDDPGAAARVIGDFAKQNKKLVVRLVSIGGKLLDAKGLERLAKLPTYKQSISLLMAVIKAPIEKFVRTLAEPHTKLVRTVAAIGEKKKLALDVT